MTASGAYIADTTPPEKRAGAFGMIGAAFGLGFVLGPAIGGLCGQVDPRLPFWVAGALCLANGIYGAIVLPESLRARAPRDAVSCGRRRTRSDRCGSCCGIRSSRS